MTDVVLGVDGGGTKTHAAVVDSSCRTLGAAAGGPSNWESAGLFRAGNALKEAVETALSRAGVAAANLAASVFGLGGCGRRSSTPSARRSIASCARSRACRARACAS